MWRRRRDRGSGTGCSWTCLVTCSLPKSRWVRPPRGRRTQPRCLQPLALVVALRRGPVGRAWLRQLTVLDLVYQVVVIADRGGARHLLPIARVGVRQEVGVVRARL